MSIRICNPRRACIEHAADSEIRRTHGRIIIHLHPGEQSGYIHYDDFNHTCLDIGKDIAGTDYDVAHVKWGGSWLMPNFEQIYELIFNCSLEWTTENGVNGNRFTGPNGVSIFLPAAGERWNDSVYDAGEGTYWSSSLDEGERDWDWAYVLYFKDGLSDGPRYYYYTGRQRVTGLPVRPVRKN